MSKHPKKISEEILAKNPWWEYKHDVFSINDKQGDYYYGESHGGVMTVPVTDDGRMVLNMQYRYLRDRMSVEFPCGGLKKEETPQTGAERELLEETGYISSNWVKIGAVDGLNGLFKDTMHVFIADELSIKSKKLKLDFNEEIETIYRRPDEFEDMVKRGEIWDGKTLAAWALVRDRVLQIAANKQNQK